MSKVILVMDDPVRCIDCPLAKYKHRGSWLCGMGNNTIDVDSKTRPDWCPLKEAPEEQLVWYDDEKSDWERGYNNCLRDIVGRESDYE